MNVPSRGGGPFDQRLIVGHSKGHPSGPGMIYSEGRFKKNLLSKDFSSDKLAFTGSSESPQGWVGVWD